MPGRGASGCRSGAANSSSAQRQNRARFGTNPLGNTSTTDYDLANRPETVTAPSYWDSMNNRQFTPATANEYDAAGLMFTVTDASCSVTFNTCDALGHLSTT